MLLNLFGFLGLIINPFLYVYMFSDRQDEKDKEELGQIAILLNLITSFCKYFFGSH